jgi:hypothetical protein
MISIGEVLNKGSGIGVWSREALRIAQVMVCRCSSCGIVQSHISGV